MTLYRKSEMIDHLEVEQREPRKETAEKSLLGVRAASGLTTFRSFKKVQF